MGVWFAVDRDGAEYIYSDKPEKHIEAHCWSPISDYTKLPKDTIKKLIGLELTWQDEPVEWNGVTEKCVWTYDRHNCYYFTSCGDAWRMDEDDPYNYCNKCGRKIEFARSDQAEDE